MAVTPMPHHDPRTESYPRAPAVEGSALARFADLLPSAFPVDGEQTFDALIRQYADTVVVFGVDGVLHYVSQAAQHMLGYAPDSLVGRNLVELLHPQDRQRAAERLQQVLAQPGAGRVATYRMRHQDGSWRHIEVMSTTFDNARGRWVLGAARDVTERVETARRLEYRIAVEELMASVSTRFVNVALDRLDDAIQSTIENLGTATGFDRAYAVFLTPDIREVAQTFRWFRAGLDAGASLFSTAPLEAFRWAVPRLLSSGAIRLPSLDDLPAEAEAERALLEARAVQSTILVPMSVRNRLLGLIGLEAVTAAREITDDDLRVLRMVAELIVSAIERRRGEEAARESEARLRALADATMEGILINDNGRILEANAAAARMFGLPVDKGLGRSVLDFVAPESHATLLTNMAQGVEAPYELVGVKADGTRFDMEVVARDWPYEGRRVRVATIRDITDRKRREFLQRLLHDIDRRVLAHEPAPPILQHVCDELSRALDCVRVWIVAPDEDGRGAIIAEAGDDPFAADIPAGAPAAAALAAAGARGHPVIWFDEATAEGGTVKPAEHVAGVAAIPLAARGDTLAVLCLHGRRRRSFSDDAVAELLSFGAQLALSILAGRQQEQIRHLAHHDALTNLPNRRSFEDALTAAVENAKRGHVSSLLVLDLDHFKVVNDTLGHAAGDRLLVDLAAQLRTQLRGSDVLARLGGDEFAVLLDGANSETALQTGHRLCEAVEEARFAIEDRTFAVGVSIGVTPIDGRLPAQATMALADSALYAAKERGKNRAVLFESTGDQDGVSLRASQWAKEIRDALRSNGFSLVTQPIMRLDRGEVAHHELLLRLRRSDGELAPPGAFLDAAERAGLLPRIDQWVVEAALSELKRRPSLSVFVNLSAAGLADTGFLAWVEEELQRWRPAPGHLVFEIAETAAAGNVDRIRQFMLRLRELGCQFALDDFGAGFSSFSLLRTLPVDYVKIAGTFVRDLESDPADRAIVAAMVAVVRALGKTAIAEWVDSPTVVAMLRDLDVELGQGYYWGQPSPMTPWGRAAGDGPAARPA